MARTKQEVRDFLNSKVGYRVADMSNADLNGQCVALIKALLSFLGVPNPYGARGNAKDAATNYVKQGIARNKKGWLNVCVNKDMGLINGVRYGHIWIDIDGEANFEQNGAKALSTTKNTRPITQAQQIVNLDQWIKEDEEMVTKRIMDVIYRLRLGRLPYADEYERNVGKRSADWVDETVVNSAESKEKAAKVKEAKALLDTFRSSNMRS